ncbi:MAG: hypothetical protein FOGNACKC_02994 [Anaerolineae bacterium]|nr:hypothetical protein [Anaerolineae bacterium]
MLMINNFYELQEMKMSQQIKASMVKFWNDPTARLIFILGTMVLAMLAGAAPHDVSGA